MTAVDGRSWTARDRPAVFREPGMEIDEGLHAIGPTTRGQFQGGYSRAYLIEQGNELTLVDALWDKDAHMILKYLWSIGRSPEDLTRIVMTHAHRSHLGGLAVLKQLSGATVYSHADEKPIIEGKRSARKIPLTPLRPPEVIPFRVASQLGLHPHAPCNVDVTLVDKQKLGAKHPLTVLHLPGHTSGNLALSWRGNRVLIVADMVMTWPTFSAGWPGFNTDEEKFRTSLDELVSREPEVVCTGHGDPIPRHAARRIACL